MENIILIIAIIVSGTLSVLLYLKGKTPTERIEDVTNAMYNTKDRKLDKKFSIAFFILFIMGLIILLHTMIIPIILKWLYTVNRRL